jgi:hypothetical protein
MLSATTLSNLIYANIQSEFGEIPALAQDQLQKFTDAIAGAIVSHITTSAEVVITPADAGLQRDPATFADTLAPLVTKTLSVT